MANGTDLATYAVDRRGQWLLPLPNASPPFGPGPPPRTAPVTVLVRRGTDQLVSQTVTVTENELTTVATIVLQIGRASCRERVCQNVYISVAAVTFTKKHI